MPFTSPIQERLDGRNVGPILSTAADPDGANTVPAEQASSPRHAAAQFHMAVAYAAKNAHRASYERLLNQGQHMLRLQFEYLERTGDGNLLTDEHEPMLKAIRAKNVELADELVHAHTRQFQDNFIAFLCENYTTDISFGPSAAAESSCPFLRKLVLSEPERSPTRWCGACS